MMLGDEVGMVKLLFHRETRVLLGVHALGQRATEIIHIGQAVLFYRGSVEYFRDMVFNYPTLAEAYKVAALDGLNKLRSEEHTSELQSRLHLVCRLLLEKKKKTKHQDMPLITYCIDTSH